MCEVLSVHGEIANYERKGEEITFSENEISTAMPLHHDALVV